MAVYNGGIRFAPDIYYEIKENGENIKVLRNGEEISGGSNVLYINSVIDDEENNYYYYKLDKTWQEIHDAFIAGTLCMINNTYTSDYPEVHTEVHYLLVYEVADYSEHTEENAYRYVVSSANISFATDQPSDYPTTRPKE
jgi:hypothetical protein